MWQRWNGTSHIFEKSDDNGGSWAALPLDASILNQGSVNIARFPTGGTWSLSSDLTLSGAKLIADSNSARGVQWGSSARMRWNSTKLELTDAAASAFVDLLLKDLYEKGRTTPVGHGIAVAYASGNFTAATGTWTVDAGDHTLFTYTLVGKEMTVYFLLTNTSNSAGTVNLRIAIPGGFTSAIDTRTAILVVDNGAAQAFGQARVVATDNGIYLYKDSAGNNWGIGTNNTTVIGQIKFLIS